MLGVYTAPNGNTKKQCEVLLTKSRKWSNRIKNYPMKPFETMMSYKQGILKTLEYPVGPSLLEEHDCHQIQSLSLTTCLQKCGVNSKINRDLIFGPICYGCLGMHKLQTENGIQKVKTDEERILFQVYFASTMPHSLLIVNLTML